MKLRSLLYQLAWFLGDVNAIQRGPNAIARRYVRKFAYRQFSKTMRRLLR